MENQALPRTATPPGKRRVDFEGLDWQDQMTESRVPHSDLEVGVRDQADELLTLLDEVEHVYACAETRMMREILETMAS